MLFQDDNIPVVARFMPDKQLSKEEAQKIAPMGCAPILLSLAQLRKLVPIWQDVGIKMFQDEVASKVGILSNAICLQS